MRKETSLTSPEASPAASSDPSLLIATLVTAALPAAPSDLGRKSISPLKHKPGTSTGVGNWPPDCLRVAAADLLQSGRSYYHCLAESPRHENTRANPAEVPTTRTRPHAALHRIRPYRLACCCLPAPEEKVALLRILATSLRGIGRICAEGFGASMGWVATAPTVAPTVSIDGSLARPPAAPVEARSHPRESIWSEATLRSSDPPSASLAAMPGSVCTSSPPSTPGGATARGGSISEAYCSAKGEISRAPSPACSRRIVSDARMSGLR